MSNDLIRQRKNLAMGEGLIEVPSIACPFTQVNGSDIPRGTLLDSQRGATKSGKTDHGDGDGY